MLFKEALNKYLQLAKENLEEDQYMFFKEKIEILLPYIGNYNVKRMRPYWVTNFIVRFKEDHPEMLYSEINKYVHEIKNILSTICGYYLKYWKLKDPRHIYMLTNGEQNQIQNYFDSTRIDSDLLGDEIMFRMLVETGIRINELIDLKTETFNFTNSGVEVSNKFAHFNQLSYLSGETLSLIDSYIKKDSEYLFTCGFEGDKYTTYLVLDVINSVAEEVNLSRKLTPKLIRNTFMGNYLKSGGCIHDLKELMGYKTYKNLAELIPLWKPKK